MRKIIGRVLMCSLVLCLCASTALASLNLDKAKKKAEKVLPATAEYLYTEMEADEFSLKYKDIARDDVIYTVAVSKFSREVTDYKTRYINEIGSENVVLTEDDLKLLVTKLYPDAVIKSTKLKLSKGLKKYEVKFYLGEKTENHGKMEINPETGAVIETEMKYLEG